jgi:hypothetical protein
LSILKSVKDARGHSAITRKKTFDGLRNGSLR